MLGLMQSQPLLISSLIEFAERHHGDAEIVSRRVEGDIHRYTYRDLGARARRLANALDELKLQFSDRVATLAPRAPATTGLMGLWNQWNAARKSAREERELWALAKGDARVMNELNCLLARAE